MSQECWKIEDYLCRCCHSEGDFVNLNENYDFCGNNITLVDLLRETFNIDVLPIDNESQAASYAICEECKIKLQDAAVFRLQVLHCEKRYKNMYQKTVAQDELSKTFMNVEVDVKIDIESDTPDEEIIYIENTEEGKESHPKKLKEEAAYEDIEYLEEDIVFETRGNVIKEPNYLKPQVKSEPKQKKCSSKVGRYQRRLQYTQEDLRNAMQAVKDNRMSRLEASEFYKVPRKTIVAHLQAEIENPETKPNRELMYNFLQEIKTILTFTNATPFKSRRNQYLCAYCTEFLTNDPVELRNHTRTTHINDRTKKVDIMMRPHSKNEILRVDMENLLCVVCCTIINDWNSMFQHLKTHDIQLEQAYKRVIPYSLNSSNQCALCQEKFLTYITLDAHMDSHYSNYVCGDCGDFYLTTARLKKHMEYHAPNPSKVIWNKESLLKKLTSFKCPYCPARFPSERDKRRHLLNRHEDKMEVLTCEECGKTFKWNKSYTSHLRNVHGGKYQCSVCGKIFAKDHDLRVHEMTQHSQ